MRERGPYSVVLRDPPGIGARGWFRAGPERFRGVVESVDKHYVVVLAEDGTRRHLPKRSLRVSKERPAEPAKATRKSSAETLPRETRSSKRETRARPRETTERKHETTRSSRHVGIDPTVRLRRIAEGVAAHPDLRSRVGGTPTPAWIMDQVTRVPASWSEADVISRLVEKRVAIVERLERRLARPPGPPSTPGPGELGPRVSATEELRRERRAAAARGHSRPRLPPEAPGFVDEAAPRVRRRSRSRPRPRGTRALPMVSVRSLPPEEAFTTRPLTAGEISGSSGGRRGRAQARKHLATAAQVAPSERRWVTGVRPDLSGRYAYVLMIRHPSDPERRRRGSETGDIAPHRTLAKVPVETFMRSIANLLTDGEPRSFNRISVELTDKTADVTTDSPFEEALWRLVEAGRVEFTPDAPVLFRRSSLRMRSAPRGPRGRSGKRDPTDDEIARERVSRQLEAWREATGPTAPRLHWTYATELMAIRRGADADVIRRSARIRSILTRAYNHGEPVWMAADEVTLVAKAEAKPQRSVSEELRAVMRANERALRRRRGR